MEVPMTVPQSAPSILSGTRVVEVASGVAVAYCTQLLAQLGAGQGEGSVGAALMGDGDGGICALMQEALHIRGPAVRSSLHEGRPGLGEVVYHCLVAAVITRAVMVLRGNSLPHDSHYTSSHGAAW